MHLPYLIFIVFLSRKEQKHTVCPTKKATLLLYTTRWRYYPTVQPQTFTNVKNPIDKVG